MPEFTIRIKTDSTGKLVSSTRGGGATSSGTSAGETASNERQAASIGRATRREAVAFGASSVPWFLDPTTVSGSALRRVTAAQLDPMMSGGEQQSIRATQGARVGAFHVAEKAGANKELATAIANAVGAAVEKAMERQTAVSRQATSSVQSVAAQYARAGKKLPREVVRKLLEAERAAVGREYDARVEVAGESDNIAASQIGRIQRVAPRIANILDPVAQLGNFMGMLDAYESDEKAQVERQKRTVTGTQRGGSR